MLHNLHFRLVCFAPSANVGKVNVLEEMLKNEVKLVKIYYLTGGEV